MGKFWDWLSGESNRRKLFKNDKATDGLTVRGIYDDLVGNSQIDKTLSAQSKENALIRDYNLNLAKMQNSWNIEQWQRENQYNSPAAQAARLQAAGLNTDMMYGQGGVTNISASSPAMTSGAAASPQDWSSLAKKQTALSLALQQAQIANINADTREKEVGADKTESDIKWQEAMNPLLHELQVTKNDAAIKELELLGQKINDVSADVLMKNLEYGFRQGTIEDEAKIIKNKLKMSNHDVQNYMNYWIHRLKGMEYDALIKEHISKWEDPSFLEELGGDGTAAVVKLLMKLF